MIELERHGKREWIYWDKEEMADAHEQWRQLYAMSIGLAITILVLAVPCFACDKGYIEVTPGVCSEDIKPEGATTTAPTTDPKIVSAEKPPKNPQPAWETGEVKADLTGGPGPKPECAGGAEKINGKCE